MKAILKYGCLAMLGLFLVASLVFLAWKSAPLPSNEAAMATLPESEQTALAALCRLAGISW